VKLKRKYLTGIYFGVFFNVLPSPDYNCFTKCLVSSDEVAPSRMVDVSASVNLPLHNKVQKVLFWHRLTRVVLEKWP